MYERERDIVKKKKKKESILLQGTNYSQATNKIYTV